MARKTMCVLSQITKVQYLARAPQVVYMQRVGCVRSFSTNKKEEESTTGGKEEKTDTKADTKAEETKGNWWSKIFNFGGEGWGRKFYEGGFQDDLDKREAAMILGVRQNAPKELIMDRYRTLMRSNHPDLGGSPYLASKVNDAKELLATRAKSDPKYAERAKRRAEREKRKKARQEDQE